MMQVVVLMLVVLPLVASSCQIPVGAPAPAGSCATLVEPGFKTDFSIGLFQHKYFAMKSTVDMAAVTFPSAFWGNVSKPADEGVQIFARTALSLSVSWPNQQVCDKVACYTCGDGTDSNACQCTWTETSTQAIVATDDALVPWNYLLITVYGWRPTTLTFSIPDIQEWSGEVHKVQPSPFPTPTPQYKNQMAFELSPAVQQLEPVLEPPFWSTQARFIVDVPENVESLMLKFTFEENKYIVADGGANGPATMYTCQGINEFGTSAHIARRINSTEECKTAAIALGWSLDGFEVVNETSSGPLFKQGMPAGCTSDGTVRFAVPNQWSEYHSCGDPRNSNQNDFLCACVANPEYRTCPLMTKIGHPLAIAYRNWPADVYPPAVNASWPTFQQGAGGSSCTKFGKQCAGYTDISIGSPNVVDDWNVYPLSTTGTCSFCYQLHLPPAGQARFVISSCDPALHLSANMAAYWDLHPSDVHCGRPGNSDCATKGQKPRPCTGQPNVCPAHFGFGNCLSGAGSGDDNN